jgi:hypothetical protein
MLAHVKPGMPGRLFPIVTALAGFAVLVDATLELVGAGDQADATATLTPASQGLWTRASISLCVILVSLVVISCRKSPAKHPIVLFASVILFSASVSVLAFDVYWWNAAGSFVDLTQKQIPRSLWKSYRVMGISFLASVAFGIATVLLLPKKSPVTSVGALGDGANL